MNERDRLIELLNQVGDNVMQLKTDNFIDSLADHLLANGVIVPPCKVGDRLYQIVEMNHTYHAEHNRFISDFPLKVEPYQIIYRNLLGDYSCIPFSDFGKNVFLTRKEAEQALAEGSGE